MAYIPEGKAIIYNEGSRVKNPQPFTVKGETFWTHTYCRVIVKPQMTIDANQHLYIIHHQAILCKTLYNMLLLHTAHLRISHIFAHISCNT